MRAALVSNGRVVNVIEYDPQGDYKPPTEHHVVPDANSQAQPGGLWDGTSFSSPPPPAPPIDRFAAVRNQLAGATTLPSLKSAITNLLDVLGP